MSKQKIGGVTLEIPSEVRAIQKGFRDVIGACWFDPEPSYNGYRYRLGASQALSANVDGRVLSALPFYDGPAYLLAAECFSSPDEIGEQIFSGFSITVLRGTEAGKQPKPLLRIEWQSYADPSESPNAQPHWHIYAEQQVERMHFAIAAQWHDTTSAHQIYVPLDESSLRPWVGGCLEYVRTQLEYLKRKRGN